MVSPNSPEIGLFQHVSSGMFCIQQLPMKTTKIHNRLLAGIVGLLLLAGVVEVAWLALAQWQRTYDRGSNSGWTLMMMIFFICFIVWMVVFTLLTPKAKGGSHGGRSNPGTASTGRFRWRGPL